MSCRRTALFKRPHGSCRQAEPRRPYKGGLQYQRYTRGLVISLSPLRRYVTHLFCRSTNRATPLKRHLLNLHILAVTLSTTLLTDATIPPPYRANISWKPPSQQEAGDQAGPPVAPHPSHGHGRWPRSRTCLERHRGFARDRRGHLSSWVPPTRSVSSG